MRANHIKEAKEAAKTFLRRIEEFEERKKTDEDFAKYCDITGYKETGALRRSSLDLTRALSKMRKGR